MRAGGMAGSSWRNARSPPAEKALPAPVITTARSPELAAPGGIRGGLLEAVGQRRHGWDRQGIEGIGPVERERPDPFRLLDAHKVCHGVLLERGRGAENLRQPGYRGNARIAILSLPQPSGLG
jgi:hypothetical protein